jgi:hypothetical protein
LPEPDSNLHQQPTLGVEPLRDPDAILPASRFRIADPDLTDVLIVSGELSDYYLRKIESGAPPNTLLERSVEYLSFVDADALVLAPVKALTPGETYSIAAPEHGLIGTFRVTDAPVPMLERRFPAAESPAFPAAVFCGADVVALPSESWLEPGHVPLGLSRGVFGDEAFSECVSLRADGSVADGTYSFPVALGETSLDPAPLVVSSVAPAEPAECLDHENPFASGCVEVLDDRAIVRVPDAPTAWTITTTGISLLVTPPPAGRFLVADLDWETPYVLDVGFVDAAGTFLQEQVSITTTVPRPHVVINEVLANPLGAEPAQEWIELVNDGSLTVELEGFFLADGSGASVLPAYTLPPHGFVILAREDFQRDDGSDVPVPASVPVLALSTLGQNGLTNSGELLELRSADDVLLSRFPALPKPKPGVSVARKHPSALDDDPEAFVLHAEPGASPGAPNGQ